MNYWLLLCLNLLVSPLCGLFEEIGQEHSKSFSFELPPTMPEGMKYYSDYLKWSKQVQRNLGRSERKRIVFKLFSQYETEESIPRGTVLDVTTWQDLHLLSGPVSERSAFLSAKILTATVLGEATILRMVADPLDELIELKKRQSLVAEFVKNAALFELCDAALTHIKQSEHHLYSLWLEEDTFKQNSQEKYLRFRWNFSLIDAFNKNSLCLEAMERFEEVNQVLQCGSLVCTAIAVPLAAALWLFAPEAGKKFKDFIHDKLGIATTIGYFSMLGLINHFLKDTAKSKIVEGVNFLTNGVYSAFNCFYPYDNAVSNALILSAIQERLIAIADCVRLLKNLHQNEQLKGLGTIHSRLDHFFTVRPQESSDFKELLEHLESSTFQGEPSFFSRAGRILTTFKLLNEQKDAFIEAFVVFGELDAYCSIARLYKHAPQAWSFAHYEQEGPHIELENFWNPFLDPHEAVRNSLSLGKENPRMIIFTGPNAGGKSTTMKAMMLTLILAQSITLVPAQKYVCTVFKKLRTYLTITDDIAAGNSHFKAGVLRAQELIDVAKTLSDAQYGCFALDEVFNGTSYHEGQAAAYSLIETFGKNPFLVGTTATHFPLVTELEDLDPAVFKNYKVSVTYDNHGKIQYPFTLQPGIAHQHVALDILREEGFESEFLQRANQMLSRSSDCVPAL